MQNQVNHPTHFNQHKPMTPRKHKAALKWLRWCLDNRRQIMASHEAGGGSRQSRMYLRLQSEIDMIEGILGAVGESLRK